MTYNLMASAFNDSSVRIRMTVNNYSVVTVEKKREGTLEHTTKSSEYSLNL